MPATESVTVVVPTRNRLGCCAGRCTLVLGQRASRGRVRVVVDEVCPTAPILPRRAGGIGSAGQHGRHERPAGGAGRNAGIERATTPWVAFVDDDDLWAPTKLAAQISCLRAVDGAAWVCVGCVIVDPSLEVLRASFPPRERDVADHLLSFNHVPGGGSGVLADRSLVEDVGGFDVGLSTLADWDLWIASGCAARWPRWDRPLMAYVEHGEGMARGARNIRSELEVIRMGYDRERTIGGRSSIARGGSAGSASSTSGAAGGRRPSATTPNACWPGTGRPSRTSGARSSDRPAGGG